LVRFETGPGEQLQADFTVVRRGRDPPPGSRSLPRSTSAARRSFACLREALIGFGGAPAHVLLDNPKTLVIERDACGEGRHSFNRELLALADEFGFRPRLCRPYRAKTKGKIERFNGYLRGSSWCRWPPRSSRLA
jgi:transposase